MSPIERRSDDRAMLLQDGRWRNETAGDCGMCIGPSAHSTSDDVVAAPVACMTPEPFVYVGIDLSTSKASTGVCRLSWGAGMELASETGLSLGEVLDSPFTAAAVDVPFGWPVDFVLAVTEWSKRHDHEETASSQLMTSGYGSAGERLRFRTTDRFVRQAAKHLPGAPQEGWPQGLSVTKDMITGTALHGMHVLGSRYPSLLVGHKFSDTPGGIVEAYPAAALTAWNIVHAGYKGKAGGPAREWILEKVETQVPSLSDAIDEENRGRLLSSDDLLDAFVCALVARAWHMDHTWLPDDPKVRSAMCALEEWSGDGVTFQGDDRFQEEVQQEGWIALPSASLAESLA